MAFDVFTVTSEEELATALQADVNTLTSEDDLAAALVAATAPWGVVAKGGMFTLIDNPLVANVSLRVVAKGGFFTVILET